jgi:UDP-N-acetylglucosamine pyrophosphorylase
MVFSFIAGVVVCSLLLYGVKMVLPAKAATDNSGYASENTTNTLTKLLPDIETIYHDALTMPFIKAEKKIYDKDIAEYYRALMDKTGLTQ